MGIVMNSFVAALIWAAVTFQAQAALTVTVVYLWVMTGLTWFCILMSWADKRPVEKNPVRIRSVVCLMMTLCLAFALIFFFGLVWLPALMVIGHLFYMGIRVHKFESNK
jgi:hypothetical protein